MISDITLEGFKAVSERVTIPLRDFTVLVGRNSSGKSSIIEGLEWLSDCINEGAVGATRQFRRIRDLLYSGRDSFHLGIAFDPLDLSVGSCVRYGIKVGNVNEEPAIIEESLIYERGAEVSSRIQTVEGIREYQLSLKDGISKRDRELLRKRAQGDSQSQPLESLLFILDALEAQELSSATNTNEALLKVVGPKADRGGAMLKDTLANAVYLSLNPRSIAEFSDTSSVSGNCRLLDRQGLMVSRLLAQLDAEALQILIEKVGFVTGRTKTCDVHDPQGPADRWYFQFGESTEDGVAPIPGWMLSEGTRRITAILALLLSDPPPPLICIEEIENGLDPWTIKFMLEELSSAAVGGVQIIVTTHSPYLLNQVPLENVILVDRSGNKLSAFPCKTEDDLENVSAHMGAGDMYVGQHLHDALRRGTKS